VIIAAGITLIAAGLLTHYAVSFVGGIIAFLGTIGWSNEPASAPQSHH